MLSLTIHHKIYLTKEQRYALHEGIDLVLTGVSIPVWFTKNFTSEPGREVFCRYYLKNSKRDTPIQILKDGYEVVLPHRKSSRPEISDEQWRELSRQGKLEEEYYSKCVTEVSSKNLLDIKDGGSQYLFYREHNQVKKDDTTMKIAHFVTMEDMSVLTDSLCAV